MSTSLESLMREPAAATPAGAPLLTSMLSFILIGGSAALSFVGISSVAVTLFKTTPSWLISALCYAAFIVPVYLLQRRFTFRSDAAHSRALPRYVAVQLVGLGLATGFSWLCYGVIALPTPVAALIVIGLTSGINFVVLRLWAFSGT